jgi:chaperonin cofactor prefoldin
MESLIATVIPYISSSALPLVVVVIAFLYIQSQRKEVGKKRNDFEALTEYRLKLLETSQGDLKDSIKELQDAIIKLQLSINTLITEFKNLEK